MSDSDEFSVLGSSISCKVIFVSDYIVYGRILYYAVTPWLLVLSFMWKEAMYFLILVHSGRITG